MKPEICYYQVTVFGVDNDFKEYCRVIWKGVAVNEESAVNRALMKCYEEKHRNFMLPYLKAHAVGEIELDGPENTLVAETKDWVHSNIKSVTKNHNERVSQQTYDFLCVAVHPIVEKYWRSVIQSEQLNPTHDQRQ